MDKWQQIRALWPDFHVLRIVAGGKSGEPGRIEHTKSGQRVGPVNPETGRIEKKREIRVSVNRPRPFNAMSAFALDRHKRAVRMIGFGLTLDDPAEWAKVAFVLGERLTLAERGALAFAVLRSMEPADRRLVMNAAHFNIMEPPQ